jgi:hypothetical protein
MTMRGADFPVPPRGLSTEEAMAYLGVKRRTFAALKGHLTPIRMGTSRVYDIRDLDALFDQLKAASVAGNSAPDVGPCESECAQDRRPASQQGESTWVVRQASIKTPKADGELIASTAVNAFRAVSTRIRKRRPG